MVLAGHSGAVVQIHQSAVTGWLASVARDGEVALCSVEGMGHTWPSGRRPAFCDNPGSRACRLWLQHVGALTEDIGNEQIWAFFSRHRL